MGGKKKKAVKPEPQSGEDHSFLDEELGDLSNMSM